MNEGLIARVLARLPSLPIPAWNPGPLMADAVAPRERMPVCEWVERNIRLSAEQTSMPGAVRLDHMPYLREILECARDPAVEEITLCAGTQSGKTSALQFSMAYLASEDPGPMMWVAPIVNLAKEISEERMLPLFRDSPALARLIPESKRAIKATRYRLTTCTIHFTWATSASELASRPKRVLLFDEVDKYPIDLGKEGNPIALGKERQRTFYSRKLYRASTPTNHKGDIWRSYQSSSRETFRCPCAECGKYQRLVFSQLKWPAREDAEYDYFAAKVKSARLAWYECAGCAARIDDVQIRAMIARGVWCPEGYEVQDGRVAGEPPRFAHRGFWWNAIYSPFLTLSDIAAEHLLCEHDPEKRQNFTNSWLAELWNADAKKMRTSRMDAVKAGYVRGEVPEADVVLTLGADVQQDHIWFVVRAWDATGRSWLIDWGRYDGRGQRAGDLAALRYGVLDRPWRGPQGRVISLVQGFIDTRHRGEDVFGWLRTVPPWMKGCQGAAVAMHGAMMREVGWEPRKRGRAARYGQTYWMVDSNQLKDWISRMFEDEGEPRWFVPQDVDEVYVKQFFSEQKIHAPGARGRRGEMSWERRPGIMDNHLWDCEVYALAAAHLAGVFQGKLPRGGSAGGDGKAWAEGYRQKMRERARAQR